MRCSFTSKVGQKEKAFAADRNLVGFFDQDIEWIFLASGKFPGHRFHEPVQCSGGGKRHPHHVPLVANRVAKRMQSAGGIDFHFVAVNEHHTAGPQRHRQRSAVDDSGAQGVGRAIAGASHDDAIGGQPQRLRSSCGQVSGDVFGFEYFTE